MGCLRNAEPYTVVDPWGRERSGRNDTTMPKMEWPTKAFSFFQMITFSLRLHLSYLPQSELGYTVNS